MAFVRAYRLAAEHLGEKNKIKGIVRYGLDEVHTTQFYVAEAMNKHTGANS